MHGVINPSSTNIHMLLVFEHVLIDNFRLFLGIVVDGSVLLLVSEILRLMKASCAKSFGPFPAGI